MGRPQIDPCVARFRLHACPSRIDRWGVFASETIPAGRQVIEYTGETIGRWEVRRRFLELWKRGWPQRVYFFRLNPYWSLDAAVGGSGAELVNHSCEPNLKTRRIHGHIYYFSRRRIRRGEELTVDYRVRPDAPQMPCRCGSPSCRGTINLLPKGRRIFLRGRARIG